MSVLWVLGAIASATPARVRAWRSSVARMADAGALPRSVAPPGAPDVVVGDLLAKWRDRRAIASIEVVSRGASITVAARSEGPNAGILVCVVAALAALARTGATGDGYLASADASAVFRVTLGPRWSVERLRAVEIPAAMSSAPLAAAERYVARCTAALASGGRKPERDVERLNAARAEAARWFGRSSDEGFSALSRTKGAARRAASRAALGWITHDVTSAERRKRIQRDPRWIELVLPFLEGGDFDARADATLVAALAKDRRAVGPLIEIVAKLDNNFVQACDALARIGDSSAIPELERALAQQKLPWMRAAASKAIAKLRAAE